MAHKRKSVHLTTGSAGQSASGSIDFGQSYARVNRVQVVADASNGWDSTTDITVVDADGRTIYIATSIDPTTAAGTDAAGRRFAAGVDVPGPASDVSESIGDVFHGPATATVANAGNTKGGTVYLYVEI